MPDYCENDVTFTSTRKRDIERLKKRATSKENPFDFNGFIPYPRVFKCIDKLAKMREANRTKEAEKRGKKNFYELSNEDKAKVEKKYPYIKDGFNQGGYKWCLENWGTTWNSCNTSVDEKITKEDGVYIWKVSFDTAWTPPSPIFENIAKRYPKINIEAEYKEEGCNIDGKLIYKDGEFKTPLLINF